MYKKFVLTGLIFTIIISFVCVVLETNAAENPVSAEKASMAVQPKLVVQFQFENVPENRRFIAEIVQDRIGERSSGGIISVKFQIDPKLEEEEYILKTEKSSAQIIAGSFPGLIFGTGRLLRSIEYKADDFTVPVLSIRDKPDAPFRECYFARHFHNWYHLASEAEMKRYIEDLALQGFNSFCTLDLPVINLTNDPNSKEWKELEKGFRIFSCCVKRLDLKIDSLGTMNQGWRDTPKELYAVPNKCPRCGNNGINICPQKPGAYDYIANILRTVNKTFADCNVDISCFWPYDEGGCGCEKCAPWGGNGYLKLAEKFARIIRSEFDPNRKFILSTWCFNENEFEILWKWLEKHPEFEYILADSHGDFPRYVLEHPLPPGHKIITFPEISMWNRWPWGGFGATVLPEHFTALWHQVRGRVCGCKLYSEGPFEDINKVIVERFYWDANANAYDTIRDYAHYEFCGANPDDFVELCRCLEILHCQKMPIPPEYKAAAIKAMRLAVKMNAEMIPRLKDRLRWRQVYCRCLIEFERNVHNTEYSVTYADAIDELQKLYHSDQVPEDINDSMHSNVRPKILKNDNEKLKDLPRPEKELAL